MTDEKRWIEDALDTWLSPEVGTGPEGDEGWRERSGYFKSAWQGVGAALSKPSAPQPSAPQPEAPAPDAAASARSWLAEGYDEERAKLRAAMTGFVNRLLYAFPDRNAMTIDDLAAAAGWIADVERQVRTAGGWAVLHKAQGRPELDREFRAALAELGQLKQVYALQRGRIEQRDRERVQQINRDREAFVREQEKKRLELARETDNYIAQLWQAPKRQQDLIRDRQHRDFVSYLRGETVVRVGIEPDI